MSLKKFKVFDTFTLSGQKYFYIAGEILEGTIFIGDTIRVSWNTQLGLEGVIEAIEMLDTDSGSYVVLGINVEQGDKLTMWQGMNISKNEILNIHSPTTENGKIINEKINDD